MKNKLFGVNGKLIILFYAGVNIYRHVNQNQLAVLAPSVVERSAGVRGSGGVKV